MMRMTDVSYMQFYENVDMKMIRSIWSPWQKELGATAMKNGNDAMATSRFR